MIAPHAQTAQWAADALRQRIAGGRLLPGEKLLERTVAEDLGLSRNTLRVAFTQLAEEGLVARIPNRGVFVARPGAEDVKEIYRVRRVVEPAAVRWGALDSAVVSRMEGIVASARGARKRHDVPAMAAANDALHREVVAMTGSETLGEVMHRVMARTRLVFLGMANVPDFHSHYVQGNGELVSRLAAGDREAAAAGLLDYLHTAEAELLGHLE